MKTHLYLFAFVLFFSFSVAHAQNKKEQIVLLNQTVDSLLKIVSEKEKTISEINILQLKQKSKNDSLSAILTNKNIEVEKLNNNLNEEIKKLNELRDQSTKNEKKHQFELNGLLNQHKLEMDSIKRNMQNQSALNMFEYDDFPVFTFLDEVDFNFEFFRNDDENEMNSEKLNGMFRSYYPNYIIEAYSKNGKKIVYAQGAYKDGLKDGHWTYFLCDGSKQCEGDYKNGLKTGIWKNYDFCHYKFNFSGNQTNYGFLSTIYTLIDYYNLGEDKAWDFVSENVRFTNNIPGDTLYLVDAFNTVKLKISWRDSTVMYGNGTMVSNSKRYLDCPFDVNQLKDCEFDVYSITGQIVYKLSKSGDIIKEFHFDSTGQIKAKNEYFKGEGKIINYDRSGKITDQYENTFGTGKYEPECPCQ
jgi:antitoxin component YwqK of YwqJK toxin-antitoxin module